VPSAADFKRNIARNTTLNLLGQMIPLIVGAFSIPVVIRGVGTERFGLLSLAWIVLGYFSIFDLGLGRATTKHVAEALGRNDRTDISPLIWSAVALQATMGIIAGSILLLASPVLVNRALPVAAGLRTEGTLMFRILALSIPMVFAAGSLRGALEAFQRFDLVNLVNLTALSFTFGTSALGAANGLGIHQIVGVLVAVRAVVVIAYLLLVTRFVTAQLPQGSTFDFRLLRRLAPFGAWVMVSNIIMPIFLYLDRFLVAALQGPTQLSYYVVPFEVVTRAWIIPASLVSALFPVFSGLHGAQEPHELTRLVWRSTGALAVMLAPLLLGIALAARVGLRIWIGSDFAERSAEILRVLAVGVFLSSLGYVPFTLVQSVGRPDVPAKYHMIELPVYGLLTYEMVRTHGAIGAAWAWVIRLTWTVPIITWLSLRVAAAASKGGRRSA